MIMNDEQKAFLKTYADYREQLDPSDPPDFWEKEFLKCVPNGDQTKFIKEWLLKLKEVDQAYFLNIFAKKGHVEIAKFLEPLDKSKDDLARELAGDARKSLEEFLAS